MKHRFDEIDSNHSGSINSKELYVAFRKEKYKFDSKLVRKFTRLFDDDESGKLEFPEFINLSLYIRELQFQFARHDKGPRSLHLAARSFLAFELMCER
jgi:Ca2+-binding EF-hand superfamily protein